MGNITENNLETCNIQPTFCHHYIFSVTFQCQMESKGNCLYNTCHDFKYRLNKQSRLCKQRKAKRPWQNNSIDLIIIENTTENLFDLDPLIFRKINVYVFYQSLYVLEAAVVWWITHWTINQEVADSLLPFRRSFVWDFKSGPVSVRPMLWSDVKPESIHSLTLYLLKSKDNSPIRFISH